MTHRFICDTCGKEDKPQTMTGGLPAGWTVRFDKVEVTEFYKGRKKPKVHWERSPVHTCEACNG